MHLEISAVCLTNSVSKKLLTFAEVSAKTARAAKRGGEAIQRSLECPVAPALI